MHLMKLRTVGLMSLFLFSGLSRAALPEDYQSYSASEKQDLLWQEVASTPWENLPPYNNNDWSSILKNIKALFSLSKTFDHTSDEIPEGRVKFIHTYGSVVKFSFEPAASHPFTGMYQTGAPGIARLSLAANPDVVAYTPGMAVKFLVDGQPSLNIVVMNSLEGQDQNRNFFAKKFSNKIDEPQSWTLWLLGKVFELARNPATDLPVNHIAAVHSDGEKVTDVHSPDQLILKPSQDVNGFISENSTEDVRVSFSKIPSGSVLYDVYGLDNGVEIYIGQIKTTSEIISSRYGDKKLFFQHKR